MVLAHYTICIRIPPSLSLYLSLFILFNSFIQFGATRWSFCLRRFRTDISGFVLCRFLSLSLDRCCLCLCLCCWRFFFVVFIHFCETIKMCRCSTAKLSNSPYEWFVFKRSFVYLAFAWKSKYLIQHRMGELSQYVVVLWMKRTLASVSFELQKIRSNSISTQELFRLPFEKCASQLSIRNIWNRSHFQSLVFQHFISMPKYFLNIIECCCISSAAKIGCTESTATKFSLLCV